MKTTRIKNRVILLGVITSLFVVSLFVTCAKKINRNSSVVPVGSTKVFFMTAEVHSMNVSLDWLILTMSASVLPAGQTSVFKEWKSSPEVRIRRFCSRDFQAIHYLKPAFFERVGFNKLSSASYNFSGGIPWNE
ncbi:MAG: hypothetical protein ACE5DO_14510 [Desulfobacterales bacterium]